jgi:hypothetical protein
LEPIEEITAFSRCYRAILICFMHIFEALRGVIRPWRSQKHHSEMVDSKCRGSGVGSHAIGSAKRRFLGADLIGHALPVHGYTQIGLAQVRADGPFRLAPHIIRALPVKIRSPKLCHCYPAKDPYVR